MDSDNIIENTSLEYINNKITYPVYEIIPKNIKPNMVLDLNEILIYSNYLINLSEISKYTTYKNFLLIYKDYDMNIFIIYYRNYLRDFLLELNNYYDIYIYSSLPRTQTDLFITCIIHLLGFNPFKKVFIKEGYIQKDLIQLNLDPLNTIIIDIAKKWKNDEQNLIYINAFTGPFENEYENNKDLLFLKKCLLRIYKLFIDHCYDDIRKYIQECIINIENI